MSHGVSTTLRRLTRFYAVGLLSLTVKLGILTLLVEWASWGYLWATALSVEAAIVHGFLWHHLWTWRDRRSCVEARDLLVRLLRHNAVTGALALLANLALMRLLVGTIGLHYLLAGGVATALAGLANYFIADSLVFVTPRRWREHTL
jgi:putative flippase GtrA